MPSKPRTPATASLGHLASDLRLVCMRISRRARHESTNIVAPHQFSVLCRLQEKPRTPKELAEIECVSAPSMTRTVAGLVEAGLVSRTDDPADGRQVIVALTGDGRTVWRHVRRRRDQWMAQRLQDLPPDERDVLARAVEILARVVGE